MSLLKVVSILGVLSAIAVALFVDFDSSNTTANNEVCSCGEVCDCATCDCDQTTPCSCDVTKTELATCTSCCSKSDSEVAVCTAKCQSACDCSVGEPCVCDSACDCDACPDGCCQSKSGDAESAIATTTCCSKSETAVAVCTAKCQSACDCSAGEPCVCDSVCDCDACPNGCCQSKATEIAKNDAEVIDNQVEVESTTAEK